MFAAAPHSSLNFSNTSAAAQFSNINHKQFSSTEELEDLRDKKRHFLELFETDTFLAERVQDLVRNKQRRLIVNINRLRSRLPERANGILNGSTTDMLALESALCDYIATTDPGYYKQNERFFVGYEGSFGSNHVNPRSLNSDYLGKLVCVEGIVTKCNNIHPKLVKSVHYCPATKKTFERLYTDLTSLDPMPTNSSYPTKDDNGNLLETEFGLSVYKDTQNFVIQELPEKSPVGQLPRSLEILCEEDLVDQVKPGDRCLVIGTYRCLPGKRNGYTNASFRTILLCNNIKRLTNESTVNFTPNDVQKIRQFILKKKNIVDVISESIAPSIWGNSYIKRAILCQLIGGNEKHLPNGTRLRGDINVMLLGDPSVAKSQFLRYVLNVSPRAINTTGRGSTGVGLTAAVTIDPETHERRLEAGAMVLADRGIVCIDEFDKMLDTDKTAIHEVMEQGKVTIAKAGIQAQLNARCSVLAAANPVWGKYDEFKSPMENIGMQDSLLSRFDLLFIVLDTPGLESDSLISDHVLNMHLYRPGNQSDGEALSLNFTPDFYTTEFNKLKPEADIQMFDNFDYKSSGISNSLGASESNKQQKQILSIDFLKKYLQIAKNLKPEMTTDACNYISEEYSKIRSHESDASSDMAKTQPITPRALETLIRISTAHAKARFSLKVTIKDAKFAVELLQYCLFKKIVVKPTKKNKQKANSQQDDSGTESSDESSFDNISLNDVEQDAIDETHFAKKNKPSDKKITETDEIVDYKKDLDTILSEIQSVGDTEFEHAKQVMSQIFENKNTMSVELSEFKSKIETSTPKLSQSQISQVLSRMEADNQIMLHEDIIYLI